MEKIKTFIADEDGFTGAEKAILTVVALGIILAVGAAIKKGADTSAQSAAEALDKQKYGKTVGFP